MTKLTSLVTALGLSAACLVLTAAPAAAAPTESALLSCTSGTYTVTGFGRGQVLHVEGSQQRFLPMEVRRADGTVLFRARGGTVTDTCTATSPASGSTLTFLGFFTPRS